MDRNRGIGHNGKLPWHLPADLQRFKALTMGHHIIMGRKTWESIGRLLPGRTSIVITRNRRYSAPGAQVCTSLTDALAAASGDREPFVIGGEQIFQMALPCARRIYLTQVLGEYPADAFFPKLEPAQWQQTQREHHASTGEHPAWDFAVYERITAV
jgi:dihydrofolate reductase